MSAATGPEPPLSVESLKQLKATETEWDEKLKQVREEGERTLARLREAADLAVREARLQADRDREAAVVAARSRIAAEADKIQEEGRRAAESIDREKSRDVRSLRSEILDAVLGPFRSR